jgi:intracellular multiplication protein IcmO
MDAGTRRPKDTFELFRKAGGDAYFSQLDGYDAVAGSFSTGSRAQSNASVQKQERIRDEDKKSAILALHINRFLQIRRPHLRHLPASATRIGDTDALLSNYIHAQRCRGEQPLYPALDDPILSVVKTAASHMNEISRFDVPPVERGIVLFQAARRALRQSRADGRTGPSAPGIGRSRHDVLRR